MRNICAKFERSYCPNSLHCPNSPQSTVPQYQPDTKICPLETLMEYLHRTKLIHKGKQSLFISYIQPHHKVSRDTISRWTKSVLESAGIDTTMFTAHNTRPAAASKAQQEAIPIHVILKTVRWKSRMCLENLINPSQIQVTWCQHCCHPNSGKKIHR